MQNQGNNYEFERESRRDGLDKRYEQDIDAESDARCSHQQSRCSHHAQEGKLIAEAKYLECDSHSFAQVP